MSCLFWFVLTNRYRSRDLRGCQEDLLGRWCRYQTPIVRSAFADSQAPIVWEEVDVTPILKDGKTTLPADAVASVKKNTVALKGPLATPSEYQ